MSVWNLYDSRQSAFGTSKRDSFEKREKRYITNNIIHSLSYHQVKIDDDERNVSIINSDNLNQKTIISMPGESIRHGALVAWMDNYWLITEKDANTTLYEKGKMEQCNHLLKWVSSDGVIHEQWCIVEDGTKYLTGEYEDWFTQFSSAVMQMKINLSNCWKFLRATMLQRSDEIRTVVNA